MKKSEQAYQDKLRELGCIVCIIYEGCRSDCDIHHRLSGGRRMGEMFVLPLCYWHHRSGEDNDDCISRDHNQKRFEMRYGTEEWLQQQADERIRLAA